MTEGITGMTACSQNANSPLMSNAKIGLHKGVKDVKQTG